MIRIRPFRATDEGPMIALWEACGLVVAGNDPSKDIARKCQHDPELFLVGEVDGVLVASCMAGYEGHRGWINYLAVYPGSQRRGYASSLMKAAEQALRERGCPKINLQVRTSNRGVIAFYRELGFAVDDVVSLGKRLVDDRVSAG